MAELALGILGAVDVCMRGAKKIRKTCKTFSGCDEEIEKATILVGSVLIRIEVQMRFLRKIAELLEPELAQSQLDLLHVLRGKLEQTVSEIEVPNSGTLKDYLRRWKWAIKDKLHGLANELEAWQNRFDPTWYLIILNSNQALDGEIKHLRRKLTTTSESQCIIPDHQLKPITNLWSLRAASRSENEKKLPVYLNPSTIKDLHGAPIFFSGARIVNRQTSVGSIKRSIVENITRPDGSHGPLCTHLIKADVELLARKLQQVEPETFHLLKCQGLIERSGAETPLELAYSMPETDALPTSLRAILLDRSFVTSLSSVMKLAKQLVRSVSFVHACGFVHKNIRPENILLFPSKQSLLGDGYLVGFSQFRHNEQQSEMLGDICWYRNLYRHPDRQGSKVHQRYIMQHDIYSLGVCLLEIGLWQSFVQYPGLNPNSVPVLPPSSELHISDQDFQLPHLAGKLCIKEQLVDVARIHLPLRMGDMYTEVAITCLECLNMERGKFSDGILEDKNGVIVGTRFIEHVISRIDGISI